MASPSWFEKPSCVNSESERINPQRPVLVVTPLNSRQYIGPPMSQSPTGSSPASENETMEKKTPAVVYLPSSTTRDGINNILATDKLGIVVTGSAALGKIGPVIGAMDIAESEDSYVFRVNVPGVSREKFTCEIESDGKVIIKGVCTTGEKIVCKNSQIFQMKTQNLCKPGHFSVSFLLPGPVDPQQLKAFHSNGVFEGIIQKAKAGNSSASEMNK